MKMSVSDWEVVQENIKDAIPTFEGAMLEATIERRTFGKRYSDAAAIAVPKDLVPAVLKIMSDNDLKQHLTEWVTDSDGVKRKVVKKVVPRVP